MQAGARAGKGRIGMIGTGAIGGFYGVMLARAGHDVHFLLRSEFAAVAEDGLRIASDVHGALSLDPVQAYRSAEQMPPCEWLLVGAKTTTAMVTVQIPDGVPGGLSDADVETALRTIAVRTPPSLDEQVAALPFKLSDTAGFRPVRVIAGATYLLTDGPNDIATNPSQPMIIIASNLNTAPEPSLRMDFAKQAFASLTGIKEVQSNNETSSQANGAEWVEIDGSGKDSASGEPLYVAQIARFETSRYVRAILIVKESEKDKYSERFRKLAKSMTIN